MTTQHYLITNIDVVTIQGGTPNAYGSTDVHLHASAIVLTRNDRSLHRPGECRIRLFGPDSAWPITDLVSMTIDHEIAPVVHPFPGALETSYDLRVGSWHLQLATESQDGAPPDIVAYPDGTPIGDVWHDLRAKVAEHWRRPNMPLLQWVPVEYARSRGRG